MSNIVEVARVDIASLLRLYAKDKMGIGTACHQILNWRKIIDGEKYCIALVKKGELPDYPKDDPEEDAIDTGYTMGWERLRAITKERNFMQVVYVAGEEER